jgi:hypothetical protein
MGRAAAPPGQPGQTGARGPGPEAERISERLWPVTGINLIMEAGRYLMNLKMAGEKPI